MSNRWKILSDTVCSLRKSSPNFNNDLHRVHQEATILLQTVQQTVSKLTNLPSVTFCLELIVLLELLTDIVTSGFFPTAISSVLQILIHVQTLPFDDILPLSDSIASLTTNCNAMNSYNKSTSMPYTIYFNPTIRSNLQMAETMPRVSEYNASLHISERPWLLPKIALSISTFPDYLQRLYLAFKASLTSKVCTDLKHALHHGSLNLYDVKEMRFLHNDTTVPIRRVVHSSARWSIDVVLLVERNSNATNATNATNASNATNATKHSQTNGNQTNDDQPAMTYVPELNRKTRNSTVDDEPKDMDIDVDVDVDLEDIHQQGELDAVEEEEREESRRQQAISGGMGYGLMVWSMTSACNELQGIKIQQCQQYHNDNNKHENKTKVIMEIHAQVTEGFVSFWKKLENQIPTTLYLMDPRTCGTDAVLRVLEGIAVHGAKNERGKVENTSSHEQLHLIVPQWLTMLGIGNPYRLLPIEKKNTCNMMGLCGSNLQPLLQKLVPSNESCNNVSFDANGNTSHSTFLTTNKKYPYPTQQLAILSSLIMPLTLIVGPPGTGKTDTVGWSLAVLCENVCKIDHERIIITAHSNAALDQMVLRLLALYDSFATSSTSSTSSVSSASSTSSASSWSPVILRLGHTNSMNDTVSSRCSMPSLISSFSSSGHQRPRRQDIMARANVIAMTVAGACLRRFSFKGTIGALVMEEAAKITQPEAVALLSYNPQRVVMVGDPLQLAPVINNEEVRQRTHLDISLFERLLNLNTPHIVLDQQGRASPEICNLYRWRYSTLNDLPNVMERTQQSNVHNRCILDFINVSSGTTHNEICHKEGIVIAGLINYLVQECQILSSNITVLSPYRAQRSYLKELLSMCNLGSIATVDEYQGLQNEIIVISLVHRGQNGPSKFLSDHRRINVMTSRAKQCCFFVGRKETYENVGDWCKIIQIIDTYQSKVSKDVMDQWNLKMNEIVHTDPGDQVMDDVVVVMDDVVSNQEMVEDIHNLFNPLHCRLIGSHVAEEMQLSSAAIETIRDFILKKMLNKWSLEKASSIVYECRDVVFDMMVRKAAEKCKIF